jgi:predicted transcriptional regulator
MLTSLLKGVTVGEVMNPQPTTVPADMSLQQLVDAYVLPGGLRCALVMQGDKLVGLITLSDIRHMPRERWAYVPVSQVSEAEEAYPYARSSFIINGPIRYA